MRRPACPQTLHAGKPGDGGIGEATGPGVGAGVTGACVFGAVVTGAAVTGAAVTGIAVAGTDVTGIAVTGEDVTGAGVTGAQPHGVTIPAIAGQKAGSIKPSSPVRCKARHVTGA